MRQRRFLASLVIAGAATASALGGAGTASASPAPAAPAAVTGDFDCGIVTCSYVFSKAHTNTIAKDGLAAIGLCGPIPTPGNGICAAGITSVVLTAKVARSKGKCVKLNWTKTVPPASYPSTDDSKRCR